MRPLDPPDPDLDGYDYAFAQFVIECLLACGVIVCAAFGWLALDRLLGLLR